MGSPRLCTLFVALFLSAVLAAALCFSHTGTAQISGYAGDETAAVVHNATVRVRNDAERTVTTNDTGNHIVSSPPSGYSAVVVQAAGFRGLTNTQN